MSTVSDANAAYVTPHAKLVREYTSELRADETATDAYGPDNGFASVEEATRFVTSQSRGGAATAIVEQGGRFVPLHVTGDARTLTGDVTRQTPSGGYYSGDTWITTYTYWDETVTQKVDKYAHYDDHVRALIDADARSIGLTKQGTVDGTERHGNGIIGGVVGATVLGIGGMFAGMAVADSALGASLGDFGSLGLGIAAGAAIGWFVGREIGKQFGA